MLGSRLKQVPNNVEIIEIFSDTQQQAVFDDKMLQTYNSGRIAYAMISNNLDVMKKAIFSCLIKISNEKQNSIQINAKYVQYFKQKCGINIAKEYYNTKHEATDCQSKQIVQNQIFVFGVDFLSTKQIMTKFKSKQLIKVQWINPSNVSITYQSNQDLQQSLSLLRLRPKKQMCDQASQRLKWVQLKNYDVLGFSRKIWYRHALKDQKPFVKEPSQNYKNFQEAKHSIQTSPKFIKSEDDKNFYNQKLREFNQYFMGYSHRRTNRTFGSDSNRDRSRTNRAQHSQRFDSQSKEYFDHRPNPRRQNYYPYPTDRNQRPDRQGRNTQRHFNNDRNFNYGSYNNRNHYNRDQNNQNNRNDRNDRNDNYQKQNKDLDKSYDFEDCRKRNFSPKSNSSKSSMSIKRGNDLNVSQNSNKNNLSYHFDKEQQENFNQNKNDHSISYAYDNKMDFNKAEEDGQKSMSLDNVLDAFENNKKLYDQTKNNQSIIIHPDNQLLRSRSVTNSSICSRDKEVERKVEKKSEIQTSQANSNNQRNNSFNQQNSRNHDYNRQQERSYNNQNNRGNSNYRDSYNNPRGNYNQRPNYSSNRNSEKPKQKVNQQIQY